MAEDIREYFADEADRCTRCQAQLAPLWVRQLDDVQLECLPDVRELAALFPAEFDLATFSQVEDFEEELTSGQLHDRPREYASERVCRACLTDDEQEREYRLYGIDGLPEGFRPPRVVRHELDEPTDDPSGEHDA